MSDQILGQPDQLDHEPDVCLYPAGCTGCAIDDNDEATHRRIDAHERLLSSPPGADHLFEGHGE